MPQISKQIPIESHAGFPSTLDLLTHKMLEGSVNIVTRASFVAADATNRRYIKMPAGKQYMFGISASVTLPQSINVILFRLMEMVTPTTLNPWSDFVKNMNRLYPNNTNIIFGDYAAEGSTYEILYSTYLTNAPSRIMWYEANVDMYYGLYLNNGDDSSPTIYNYQIYTIEGIK